MIRFTSKKGVQRITEICDTCKCHVRDLTVDDILVKAKNSDLIVKNSKGEEVTRTKLDRPECKCEHCK